jgi:hypothetical protein
MPRTLDHLVICVRELPLARQAYQSLGFTLTPAGDLPFGVRNHVALLQGNFFELLTVADASSIPPPGPGRFSFGAHVRDALARNEGAAMLAFASTDARRDADDFARDGIGAYAPFDFGRDANRSDGSTVRFAFSLAFATDPALPGLAFFTCQQRHAPELFWRPQYQRHSNSAIRMAEVILSAAEPASHRRFLERLTGTDALMRRGALVAGSPRDRITVLDPDRLHQRFPECTATAHPKFQAVRLTVGDVAAAARLLQRDGVSCRVTDHALVLPPDIAHGIAFELTQEGGE